MPRGVLQVEEEEVHCNQELAVSVYAQIKTAKHSIKETELPAYFNKIRMILRMAKLTRLKSRLYPKIACGVRNRAPEGNK